MIYPGGIAGNRNGVLNGMIVLSLLAHVLIMSFLLFTPSQSAPKWTFGPVYSVQLVSLPASLPERKDSYASLKEITDGAHLDRNIMKKESIATLPSVAIGPIEAKKKSIVGMESVLDAVRKNVQSAANQPSPARDAVSKGMERVMSPGTSSSMKQGGADIDATMKTYYALIWSRIKGLWTLPQGMLPPGNSEVVIHAQILKDGTVTGADFEKHSGNRYFDAAALRTVKKASPLPPLPEGYKDSSLEVGIRFHSSEFR